MFTTQMRVKRSLQKSVKLSTFKSNWIWRQVYKRVLLRQFILIIQLWSGNFGLNSPNSAITDIHSFCLLKWNCFILCSFATWKIRFYLLITIFHSLIFLNTQASQCFSTHTDASYSTFWNNPAYDWTWLPVWLKR